MCFAWEAVHFSDTICNVWFVIYFVNFVVPYWPVKLIEVWRMSSSGMWRRVDLVCTDVSVERIASIFRVEESASEEPAWAGGCRRSSDTSVRTRCTRRHITQDGILHSHRRENLISCFIEVLFVLHPNFFGISVCNNYLYYDVISLFLLPITQLPVDINVGLKRNLRNVEYIPSLVEWVLSTETGNYTVDLLLSLRMRPHLSLTEKYALHLL
jgi:hypothetical protein